MGVRAGGPALISAARPGMHRCRDASPLCFYDDEYRRLIASSQYEIENRFHLNERADSRLTSRQKVQENRQRAAV